MKKLSELTIKRNKKRARRDYLLQKNVSGR